MSLTSSLHSEKIVARTRRYAKVRTGLTKRGCGMMLAVQLLNQVVEVISLGELTRLSGAINYHRSPSGATSPCEIDCSVALGVPEQRRRANSQAVANVLEEHSPMALQASAREVQIGCRIVSSQQRADGHVMRKVQAQLVEALLPTRLDVLARFVLMVYTSSQASRDGLRHTCNVNNRTETISRGKTGVQKIHESVQRSISTGVHEQQLFGEDSAEAICELLVVPQQPGLVEAQGGRVLLDLLPDSWVAKEPIKGGGMRSCGSNTR